MRVTSILVTGIVVMACGGAVTSVDGGKNTNSLSSTDQNQLCNDTYNYLTGALTANDIAKIACASAYTQGGDCNQTFDNCVASAKTTATIPPPNCQAFAASLAACNATVSEYSTCLQQEVTAFKSLESSLPFCSEGDEEAAALKADSQISATCLQLMQTCPISFGSSSSSSGGNDG